jgi:hypothetical protein
MNSYKDFIKKNILIQISSSIIVAVMKLVYVGFFLGWFSPVLFAGPVESVSLVLPAESSPSVKKIGQVLLQQIQDRCEGKLKMDSEFPFIVELAIQTELPDEGFVVENRQGGGVRIIGSNERGILYGVGKFLRDSRFGQNGFTPGNWRGSSAPDCPVRVVYLATHFNNYYEAAPVEEVVQYIESLALWGYNTILIHYPAWQFTGISDPASQEWLNRFKEVFRKAREIGLEVGLLQTSNGGFKNTPEQLLNVKVPGHRRGTHGIQLCPANPEGRSELKQIYGELLNEFSDVGLDYFVFWPYDEGGCACEDCWPWGARGFVNISKDLAQEINARFPECKFIVSTWCFENENDENPDGEWVGLTKELNKDKSWADYLMADGHDDYFPNYILTKGVPGDLPLLNFPEISMFGQSPWGGYGVNPAPAHFEKLWSRVKNLAAGGAPYSEGIYEDLNKAIIAGFYWNLDRKAEDIVREYVGFEFSPDAADDLVAVVRIFEQNHNRREINESALLAFEMVMHAEKLMTSGARKSWRWRIFYLRALMDKEIYEQNGKIESEILKSAFKELIAIYYAQNCHFFKLPQLE